MEHCLNREIQIRYTKGRSSFKMNSSILYFNLTTKSTWLTDIKMIAHEVAILS